VRGTGICRCKIIRRGLVGQNATYSLIAILGVKESIGGFSSEASLHTLEAFPDNTPHTNLPHTPTHEIADVKLRVGTYGFILSGTSPQKDKGRADRLGQLRPLVRNCELTCLSNYVQLSPAGGV
jgi:hypothetical protein